MNMLILIFSINTSKIVLRMIIILIFIQIPEEFEKNLKNLQNIKITIDRDDRVLEFYFMSSVYRNHDILINIFSKFLKKSNNWENLFLKIFMIFLQNIGIQITTTKY